MTYLTFHFIFTIPLFLFIAFLNVRSQSFQERKKWFGCALLCLLAFVYTTPWDSYLIRENIWNYSPGQVLGTIFYIPFEEYFFFFIQSVIGCLMTAFLMNKLKANTKHELPVTSFQLVLIFSLFITSALLFFQFIPENNLRYLFLILFWALPVVGLQWILGLHILLKEKKVFFTSMILLTLYFWVADSVAISYKIWTFPEQTLTGWTFMFGLPVEEALFFFLTNLMVVQGFILFTQVSRIPFLNKYEWSF